MSYRVVLDPTPTRQRRLRGLSPDEAARLVAAVRRYQPDCRVSCLPQAGAR